MRAYERMKCVNENEQVGEQTHWVRLCWLSLSLGFFIFLLWQLAEWVGLPLVMAQREVDLLFVPHTPSLFSVIWVGKNCIQSVMCGISNPHPSRARPFPLRCAVFYPSSCLCSPSNPPLMGLLINFWSCDGCA